MAATTPKMHLLETEPIIGGVMYPKFVVEDTMKKIKDMEVREDDVWLVSYPKSGTHWMKGVLFQIFNHDTPEGRGETEPPSLYDVVPFLEFPDFKTGKPVFDTIISMPRSQQRLIATHLQAAALPSECFVKKPKIIHIVRNPKDTARSYYHFTVNNPAHTPPESWESWLDNYLKGSVPYGGQADYITQWWNKRNETDQLFVTFEEMKKDLPVGVKKIATFLGKDISDVVADTIAERCSFKQMKASNLRNVLLKDGATMYRKGTAGDWKTKFTVAQSESFDSFFDDKFKDVDINFEYE